MTLAELRAADPLLHGLLVESCAGREALAAMLVDRIAKLATERAITVERERVEAHLRLGEIAGMQVAIEAIKSGAGISELHERYMEAAAARREAPLLRLVEQKTGESK